MQKKARRTTRHKRVRQKISGIGVPRLSVFRSAKHIYAQIIDDNGAKTIVAASDSEVKETGISKTEKAAAVGKLIAQKALSKKIDQIVFDRGGHRYAGRVARLAQSARESGLKF